jgi:hypothetical protein
MIPGLAIALARLRAPLTTIGGAASRVKNKKAWNKKAWPDVRPGLRSGSKTSLEADA